MSFSDSVSDGVRCPVPAGARRPISLGNLALALREAGGAEPGSFRPTGDHVAPIGDTVTVSTPEALAVAAATVRADLSLDDLLAALGEPQLVGSAAVGLMVRPDLDITVVCATRSTWQRSTARRSTS